MRKTFFILLLTLVLGYVLPAQSQTHQKITVRVNQQKTLAKSKLTIRFASLVEDSRCPTDSQCIQAGNAKITIQLSKSVGSAAKTFEINTNSKQQTVSYGGYNIKFIDLTPKPATNIRINRNAFMATFLVSKARKSK
jgi:hypothetical protein